MKEETRKRINYYTDLTKQKGFRKETAEMGIMLAHTTVLVNKFGSAEEAFEKVIEICEKNDDGEKFIAEVSDLLGIE